MRASPFSMVRDFSHELKPYGTDPAGTILTPDLLAFSLTIFLATRWTTPGLKIPTILGTIAEDATRYFLVIFTSHLVLEMTLNLGRVSTAAASPELQSTNSMRTSPGINSTSPGSVSRHRRTLRIIILTIFSFL